jgi:FdhE protein
MKLGDLERAYPEWGPWLAVVRAVHDELQDPTGNEKITTARRPRAAEAPLLAEAVICSDAAGARRLATLCERAARGGTLHTDQLQVIQSLPAEEVLESTLNGDGEALYTMGRRAGLDPDAFAAVASLSAMPLLHAARRSLAAEIPEDWGRGYCPVCGAWPVLAELCGVERQRFLRCGRCASGWRSHCLLCPYCGTGNHRELATLDVEYDGTKAAVEVCTRCKGYLKSFTRLRSASAHEILVDDLASIALDLAAAERGHRRPAGLGYRIGVTVSNAARAPANVS